MKKTYIAPSVDVTHIVTEQMVAASLNINNTPTNDVSGDVKERGDWDIFDYEEE